MVKRFPHGKPTCCSARVGIVRASDGYPLQYSEFGSSTPAKGALICIHGIQSHAGWYRESCQAYSDAGYHTYFFDRRGSGRNARDRGHCTGHAQLIDDIRMAVEHVRGRCRDLPVTLLAISWGGKLAVAALQQHPDLVDALVLMCPGWFAKVEPSLREKLAIGWSFLLWPKRLINVPLSDPSLFTASPRWQKFIAEDPLGLKRATARTLMTSKILDRVIRNAPRRIQIPSLLLLAGKDRIIDNARTRNYFEQFETGDRTVLEYPDAHHTFEFEPDSEKIFQDVIRWLDGRAANTRVGVASQQAVN
jgi:acylglycerol lipase